MAATQTGWIAVWTAVLAACASSPAKRPAALQSTGVKASAPAQPSAIQADAPAIQRRPIDLKPPPPVPLVILERIWSGEGVDPEYLLELNADGTGRYVGRLNVCVKGEVAFQVPPATVEQAVRLIRDSHVFDHPLPACSHSFTDQAGISIYFWGPAPGREVHDHSCFIDRKPLVRLAFVLDELLDTRRWVGTTGQYDRCKNEVLGQPAADARKGAATGATVAPSF